jgi:hypothetical protein
VKRVSRYGDAFRQRARAERAEERSGRTKVILPYPAVITGLARADGLNHNPVADSPPANALTDGLDLPGELVSG